MYRRWPIKFVAFTLRFNGVTYSPKPLITKKNNPSSVPWGDNYCGGFRVGAMMTLNLNHLRSVNTLRDENNLALTMCPPPFDLTFFRMSVQLFWTGLLGDLLSIRKWIHSRVAVRGPFRCIRLKKHMVGRTCSRHRHHDRCSNLHTCTARRVSRRGRFRKCEAF